MALKSATALILDRCKKSRLRYWFSFRSALHFEIPKPTTFLGLTLQGQEECSLIERASVASCKGDLNETESALRELIKDFPNHNLSEEFKLKLGETLYQSGKYNESKELLSELFEQIPDTTPRNYELIKCPTNYDSQFPERKYGCLRIVFPEDNIHIKHDILLVLSDIAIHDKEPKTSIEYLELASSKYFKNNGCGNGINMVEGYLAIKLAESYMLDKDTLSALTELIPQTRNWDADLDRIKELTQQCISALYTEEETKKIIQEASSSLHIEEIENTGRTFKVYNYQLFDKKLRYTTIRPGDNQTETIDDFRENLSKQLTEALIQ